MQAAAAEEGITPFDLMVCCIEEDAGQTAVMMFQLDENDLRAACTHRLHMFGSEVCHGQAPSRIRAPRHVPPRCR